MEGQRTSCEVFRRSWLTLTPEWVLAGSVSLAVALAAYNLGLSGWEAPILAMLPIVWAGGCTLQWACRTWTATADGRLIAQEGFVLRSRQDILLRSACQVEAEAPPLLRWLGIGHIAFSATNSHGQFRPFRWTWVARHARLYEILKSRGQLPIGRLSQCQSLGKAVTELVYTAGMGLGQGWALCDEYVVRLQGHWYVADYDRFMGFCHLLLRSMRGGHWPPPHVPAAVVRRWMMVLRQAHVVMDAPNGTGWRVAEAIRSLEDIRDCISEEDLRQAIRR